MNWCEGGNTIAPITLVLTQGSSGNGFFKRQISLRLKFSFVVAISFNNLKDIWHV